MPHPSPHICLYNSAMDNRLPLRSWRLRLIWLRSLLVLLFTLALMLLQSLGHTGYHLTQLSWLGALLLPSLITLLSHRSRKHQSQLLTLELALDTALFIVLLQSFGGAGNPLSFYLLIPALLASLTLPLGNSLLVAGLALSGYLVTFNWYHRPADDTPLHALSHELSALHSVGMAVVFVALLLMLSLLGQVIQRLMRQQQRQQEQALDLAGRREHMYQIAATLADQAHELNTPLGTLVMLADNLQSAPELPDTLRKEIGQIDQLARTVSQRLKQSTAQTLSGPQALGTLIEQVQQQLRHLAPTLEIKAELTTNPMLADGESWFRILCNLGYNAMDAGASHWVIRSYQDEQGLALQASDNGPAHPDSERQGLGMGLILVNTALEQMGASMDMEFGRQWTQVRIRYPQTGAAQSYEATP